MKIGIVTGGGDCPGLNAVIRAVAKTAAKRGWETIGIIGGYDGLLAPQNFRLLDYKALDGLLVRGGTILGTANRGQFSAKTGHGETRQLPKELLDETKRGMEALGISALVSVGGDGSLTIAQQMHEAGIPIVGVPKTIDNDLAATTITFGFDSAVACATDALDRLHTTAESHNRVMVLEVMGRYAGWIAIYAGVAGGADVILIPEIPFQLRNHLRRDRGTRKKGKTFYARRRRGRRETGGRRFCHRRRASSKIARRGWAASARWWRRKSRNAPARKPALMVLGHLQRGGSPTFMDRVLCTLFGAKAVELITEGRFGRMVAHNGQFVDSVPLAEATGRLRTVPLDEGFVHATRSLGICLGD